jgi:tRNA(Arg) A34 adenosine deaminase TadA
MTAEQLHYYMLLKIEQEFTTCTKRQVAALTVYAGAIVSIAHNVSKDCNKLCDKTCGALHAERMLEIPEQDCDVYLTRYPCAECYTYLISRQVKRIYVFGEDEKDQHYYNVICLGDVLERIKLFNANQIVQEDVFIGEMAEYITEVMNSRRKDTRTSHRNEELVDILLQVLIQLRWYDTNTIVAELISKLSRLEERF